MRRAGFRLSLVTALLIARAAGAAEPGTDDLRQRLQSFVKAPANTAIAKLLNNPRAIARFYRGRAARPVWTASDGKVGSEGKALFQAVRDSWRDGLSPADYHEDLLEKFILETVSARLDADDASTAGERALTLELLLTDAYLSLGEHLYAGRSDPAALDLDWVLKRHRIDMVKELTDALRAGNPTAALRRLAPANPFYQELKNSLVTYKALDDEATPFPAVPDGPPLKRGARDPRVVFLRTRLGTEGFLPKAALGSPLFDAPVERALRAFQRSRGLETDGSLNNATLEALNQPFSRLAHQIELNLERLRWLPRQLGSRYLFVDIAGFRLVAFDGDREMIRMRIIVGDEFRRTPMLTTRLTSVVLNPYWNIPRTIVAEAVIPKARLNPSYLSTREIRVFEDRDGARREVQPATVDWRKVRLDGSPYLFQQQSGPLNPLGSVKFLLQNNLAVYLHGTPEVDRFGQTQRTLSHGCIRLENPLLLATYLLTASSRTWTRAALRNAIEDGMELPLPLPSPVPVYLWYRTAWVEKGGRAQFRPDVYGWDGVLDNALAGNPPVVPKELQAIIRGRKTGSIEPGTTEAPGLPPKR